MAHEASPQVPVDFSNPCLCNTLLELKLLIAIHTHHILSQFQAFFEGHLCVDEVLSTP